MGLKRSDLNIGDEFEYCGGYDHTNDCLGVDLKSDPFIVGNTYRLIEFGRSRQIKFECEEWRYDDYNEWWININVVACYFIRRYRTIKVF